MVKSFTDRTTPFEENSNQKPTGLIEVRLHFSVLDFLVASISYNPAYQIWILVDVIEQVLSDVLLLLFVKI